MGIKYCRMASSKEYIGYVMDQLSELEEVSYRPMMGEYVIYYRGKVVGGVYDNRLLVKPARLAVAMLPNCVMEVPYEGAKEMLYVEEVDDREKLCELIKAMYDDLPFPNGKRNRG